LGILPAARDAEQKIRSVLGEYNKTNLKRRHYPDASVCDACNRAERLDRTVEGETSRSATRRGFINCGGR
jgi:hypothetical protein